MDHKKLNEIKQTLLSYAQQIMNEKQPEYTNKNSDVLHNFKSTAENLGLEAQEVWAVFFYKHVQAILSHAHNPNMHAAEPIESRYADALNYLVLGLALHIEKMYNDHDDLNLIYKGIE
tara:strand:- start:288 stop:641 length:354 start_codon:yes stop_codon:yes gene_type:complete